MGSWGHLADISPCPGCSTSVEEAEAPWCVATMWLFSQGVWAGLAAAPHTSYLGKCLPLQGSIAGDSKVGPGRVGGGVKEAGRKTER